MLRSLNKSYPQETYSIFEGFGMQIMFCLSNTKSSLVKNAMAFVYEMLMQSHSIHPQIFQKLLPQILKMTHHTSKSFRMCCLQCILMIHQKHANATTISIFALESVSKNNKPLLLKSSFKYMVKSIHSMKDRISELNPETFHLVFKTISWHLNNYKCKSKGSAERLCRYFLELMGADNLKEYIKTLVDDGVLSLISANQVMNKALAVKKPPKNKINFQQFKKQNRQFIKTNIRRNRMSGIPNEFVIPNQNPYF